MLPTDDDALIAGPPPEPAEAVAPHTAADLAALYPAWYPRLARYFRACGCHQALAHELAQESFVQALRGLPGFRGGSQLSTWLWAIGQRVWLAELRRKRPLDRVDDVEDLDGLMFADNPHLSEPVDCVRRGFARFAMAHPKRAEALYLHYWGGLQHGELGELIGRTERATTVYLAASRAKLAPFLKECDDC